MIIEERPRALGDGMQVGRLLPHSKRRMVGPFIFLDHLGPLTIAKAAARGMDVLPHPHIGLSTVTYLFDGEIMHRDSLGSEQAIRPGAVNWMTAGSGISHSERFERGHSVGDHLHGVQAWVALPSEYEEVAPTFAHHPQASLPSWQQDGVCGRLLAGACYGLVAPVRAFSPLHGIHLQMAAGSRAELPQAGQERGVYVVKGAVVVANQTVSAGRLAVLGDDASALQAQEPSTVLLIGGEPLGHRHIYWNFVSSRPHRLDEAAAAWQRGDIPLPPGDSDAKIPLPSGPSPAAPGFS